VHPFPCTAAEADHAQSRWTTAVTTARSCICTWPSSSWNGAIHWPPQTSRGATGHHTDAWHCRAREPQRLACTATVRGPLDRPAPAHRSPTTAEQMDRHFPKAVVEVRMRAPGARSCDEVNFVGSQCKSRSRIRTPLSSAGPCTCADGVPRTVRRDLRTCCQSFALRRC